MAAASFDATAEAVTVLSVKAFKEGKKEWNIWVTKDSLELSRLCSKKMSQNCV